MGSVVGRLDEEGAGNSVLARCKKDSQKHHPEFETG